MKKVLVTGGNGQLGLCIKKNIPYDENRLFIFKNSNELNITDKVALTTFFAQHKIDYCINCAAYTAVDRAESERDLAEQVNVKGIQNLALTCVKNKAILIHISTDFVFDGNKATPYTEEDETNPLSIYGQTKLEGELVVQDIMDTYFIIRTSWLYSEFANNFMKTMLKLGNERDELHVVNDQIGTPTYAQDLAKIVVRIIVQDSQKFGVYHYSNEGVASWYDFAKEIFLNEKLPIVLNGIPTSAYPTPAKRPKNSVLNTSKIKEMLNIDIPMWKDAVKQALEAYHKL